MEVGLHVANFTWANTPNATADTLATVARIADQGGFANLSVMDHFFQLDHRDPDAALEPMLEGYTTLGFLASETERVRLGLIVTGVTYRHPGTLAKIVTTLDVLSKGRAELGIGAAWYEREHTGLGIPFPPLAERFERLEETIQICLQMWSGDDGEYKGDHYQLANTLSSPPNISQPHPPILIGGSGEKKTLRLVARYGDACNLIVSNPEEAAHKLSVLRSHCDAAGTDYERIRKGFIYTGSNRTADQLDAFVDEMTDYAAVGLEAVIVMPGTDPVPLSEQLAAKVVPRLAQL